MAIIQISRIQHRSGNLVDLPQLSDAEFGWATDTKRLFIGKSSPNENIEVLTSYSNVNFSQIIGAQGNLNITGALAGQVLSYDGNNWVNYTGTGLTGSGNINLGVVGNVKILGGAIGYVLETDGTGKLSWTPKGTLYTPIQAVSAATPIIMTVDYTANIPYTNGTEVTIVSVAGTNANTIVNGKSFYITLAADYATSGNVALYTDIGRTVAAVGTGLVATANTGVATSVISSGSGGGASVGGSNTTIQFNNNNILDGNTGFTYDYTLNLLTLNGNANVGNLNATGVVTSSRLLSNATTGTTPIQVISTTLVPNLYVARANVSDYSVVATQSTGVFYPTFVSANTTANYSLSSNANVSFNAASGALSATLLTGTLTTAAQPNVTSVGTLAGLVVSGHITPSANITYNLGNNTNRFNDLYLANSTIYIGAQTISANATSVTISGSIVGNMSGNASTAGTVTTAAQPNITSVGTLTSLLITGNANAANFNGTFYGAATGLTAIVGANVSGAVGLATYATTANAVAGANVSGQVTFAATANAVAGGNVSGAVSFATTANAVAGANVSGAVGLSTYATTANAVAGANVTGTVANATYAVSAGSATTAGTVTTNAQPNITSTGTLSALTVSANTTTGGVKTDNYYYANGVSISFTGAYSNANVAAYLPTFTGTVGATALTTGATATAGTITGNWSLAAGSKLNATYADLAEHYVADAHYEAGTVLEFGGMNEVTLAADATNKVAGIVSTNPAYVMNSMCAGEYIIQLALQGRVPCKVRGSIRKGDMLVSAGDGFARPTTAPLIGTVIGKSLEDFTGTSGVIEVAVGRL